MRIVIRTPSALYKVAKGLVDAQVGEWDALEAGPADPRSP